MVNRYGLAGVKPRVYVPENPDAYLTFDFTRQRYRLNGVSARAFNSSAISGLSVTRATPSVAYSLTNAGLLVPAAANEARITDKGLLVEESRTNLLLHSTSLQGASWAVTGTASAGAQPSVLQGQSTSDFTDGVGNSTWRAQAQSINVTASTSYTASFIVQKRGHRYFNVRHALGGAASTLVNVCLDLDTGSVIYAGTGSTASARSLAGGVYELTITATPPDTKSLALYIGPSPTAVSNDTAPSYTGETGKGFTLHHAQIEAGAFRTSPIPTTSASATRAADSISVGVSGVFPATVLAEYNLAPASKGVLVWSDGTTAERARLIGGPTGNAQWTIIDGGSPQFDDTITVAGAIQKTAIRIAANDVRIASLGTLGTPDGTVTLPAVSTLYLGQNPADPAPGFNGYLRKVVIYPRAFTDSELQAATQ